jgi:hypothetical protein
LQGRYPVPYSLVSVLIFVACIALLWIGDKISQLLRTLRRIEARLTLLNPLDEEKTLMDKGIATLRGGLEDRAMHPDIWISKIVKEESDLRGKEWKVAHSLRRYREKLYRD